LPGQLQNFTLLTGKHLHHFITQGKYHIFVKIEQGSCIVKLNEKSALNQAERRQKIKLRLELQAAFSGLSTCRVESKF
jgi:hypothetical protein